MLKNLNTRTKLFLFPVLFILIVILSVFVYKYYSNLAKDRNISSITTEIFVQELLKGRISIYQFLRKPNEDTTQKVYLNFKQLNQNVSELRNKLSLEPLANSTSQTSEFVRLPNFSTRSF